MTSDEGPPSERVEPQGVHVRRRPASFPSSSARLGGILILGLLIVAGSLFLRGSPVASDAGDSGDPSGSAMAIESTPSPETSSAPTASPEPSTTMTPSAAVPTGAPSRTPTPPDPTDPPPPPDPPTRPAAHDGDVIATIPEGDSDDLSAQVEVVDQCLDDPDTALVTFRVSWTASSPMDRTQGDIGNGYLEAITENELGADGRFDLSGSYERTLNVRVQRDLYLQLSFFRELYDLSVPDEDHDGFWVADAKGGTMFAPQNPCP